MRYGNVEFVLLCLVKVGKNFTEVRYGLFSCDDIYFVNVNLVPSCFDWLQYVVISSFRSR